MNKSWWGLVMAAFLLVSLDVGAAGVFKWTDEQGVVHFGDQPLDAPQAERIMLPSFAAPAPAKPPVSGSASAEAVAGEAGDEAQAQQREIRAANCEIARRTLEHNQSIDRMYRLAPDGERQFLTDEEREALLARSRNDVAQWCD